MRYLKHLDWVLLLLITEGCAAVYWQAEQQFDMITKYNPQWMYGVSFLGPLFACVYFIWRYRLYDDRKNLFTAMVIYTLIAFIGLMETLPRLVLLAKAPPAGQPPVLQELDVISVNRHYARTTYTSSRVGIQYGDTVLVFNSSRTNYFLLARERCIRAEIGQAVAGFYYIRNLQRQPGEREQARSDYWAFFWRSGEGSFLIGCAGFMLVAWLLSLVLKRFDRIHIK